MNKPEVSKAQLERVIGRLIDEIADTKRAVASVQRAQDTKHTVLLPGESIKQLGEDGEVVAEIGGGSGAAVKHVDGPTPAQPEIPEANVQDGQFTVIVDGYDIHGEPAPDDLARTIVHYSREEGFDAYQGTRKGTITGASGQKVFGVAAGTWYVRVQWETLAGKLSEPSDQVMVEIEPPVDAQDIQDTLDAAQEALDEYNEEVAQPRFQALEDGLEQNTTNLSEARDRLTAAEQTLSPLPGQMQEAREDIQDALEEATTASAAAVEANNRAMTRLANGNFESGLDYWDHDNVSLTSTAHSGQQAAQVSGWLRPGSSFPVTPDQIWELSLYYQHDVTVTFETVDGDQRTVLSTHHLDGDSSWSDSGALRVTIPADVHMLSFTITGTSAIVDDITLRDVTDVVRLEEAATANRQKAEQAISELAVLQLAVDGEGGLKDRLSSAETVLETKADEAVVDNVAAGLAGLSGLNTKTYIQDEEPPAPSGAITYEWEGTPHASPSRMIDENGNVVARNESYGQPTTMSSVYFDETFNNSRLNLITYTGSGTTYVGYASGFHRVTPGEYFAHAVSFDWSTGDIGRVRHQVQFRGPNNESISAPQIVGDKSDHPNGGRLVAAYLVPEGTWEARVYSWFYLEGSFTTPTSGSKVRVGNFSAVSSETEQSALDQVATYFDGDSPAIPAETGLWVRGEDKFWFDQTTKQWVQIQDTGAFARLIANELFANLAVVDRLQAREGWIGGTLLADGAVTAEKIHATRELITRIMGAEWAYISERLVVDGSILTRDLEALSAAIQSLTVTQRADIAELWAEELWTALAVIEELQAEEAWITSAMISELTAEKVTVTQEFVARIGTFAEILGDKLWANQAFIDRMAASEAYFGSEDADQQTRVDGTGMTVHRKDDTTGEFIPALQFGGGEFGINWYDEQTGDPTGGITNEGDITGRNIQAEHYSLGGRPIFGNPENYAGDGPLFDQLPTPINAHGYRDMRGLSWDNTHWGLLEVSTDVTAGRTYEIEVPDFIVGTDKPYFLRALYTTDGSSPNWTSTTLFTQLSRGQTLGGKSLIRAEHTGPLRVIVYVYANSTGLAFPSWGAEVHCTVKDLGPSTQNQGMHRSATNTFHDNQDILREYSTGWPLGWHQNYVNGVPGYNNYPLLQGMVGNNTATSVWGGYLNTAATVGGTTAADLGRTIPQALNGATLNSGTIRLTARASAAAPSAYFRIHWHTLNSAPATFPVSPYPDNYFDATTIYNGNTHYFNLPQEVLDAIQAGTFGGFSLHPRGSTDPYAFILNNNRYNGPILALKYTR